MFGILTGIESASKKIFNYYYKVKYRHVNFGNNIIYNGFAIFRFGRNAEVKLEDNIIFNSKTKYNLAGIYKRCSISVADGAKLTIGNFTGFSGVSIVCANEINIGSNVNCGINVMIWDTDFHSVNKLERRNNSAAGVRSSPIKIGNDVFIGGNSIVLKGVIIGDNSVIGAGSVVTGTVPPNEIWAGNPAKFLKRIS